MWGVVHPPSCRPDYAATRWEWWKYSLSDWSGPCFVVLINLRMGFFLGCFLLMGIFTALTISSLLFLLKSILELSSICRCLLIRCHNSNFFCRSDKLGYEAMCQLLKLERNSKVLAWLCSVLLGSLWDMLSSFRLAINVVWDLGLLPTGSLWMW